MRNIRNFVKWNIILKKMKLVKLLSSCLVKPDEDEKTQFVLRLTQLLDITNQSFAIPGLHWDWKVKCKEQVPKLTLSVRNGHKLKDWVFGIPAHIQSKNYNQHFIEHEREKFFGGNSSLDFTCP